MQDITMEFGQLLGAYVPFVSVLYYQVGNFVCCKDSYYLSSLQAEIQIAHERHLLFYLTIRSAYS